MARDKILLVETDPRVVEMLVESFIRRFNCDITCVASAEDALDVEVVEPHTVVIADTKLPNMDAITLTQRMREFADRDVILMGDEPNAADALAVMRAGATDFFVKPFDISDLLGVVETSMHRYRRLSMQRRRTERMRGVLRHVLRDRRSLNRRVELICRDLVGAHKRLVVRVLERERTARVTAG